VNNSNNPRNRGWSSTQHNTKHEQTHTGNRASGGLEARRSTNCHSAIQAEGDRRESPARKFPRRGISSRWAVQRGERWWREGRGEARGGGETNSPAPGNGTHSPWANLCPTTNPLRNPRPTLAHSSQAGQ